MNTTEVERVLSRNRLRVLRSGAMLRAGVLVIMLAAMLIETNPTRLPEQGALLAAYAVIAIWALAMAFLPAGRMGRAGSSLFGLGLIDVMAVFGFKLLSPGGYIPLIVMALLPRMVAVGMSLRRAAVVLGCSVVVFTVSLVQDPLIGQHLAPAAMVLIALMYVFVCGTAMLVVLFRFQHVNELTSLATSREALLVQTMTSSESERRQISESIHDGPLQDVLAARRDIADFLKVSPDAPLKHALASLHEASQHLREATFELHPAVLDRVGLAAAVERLASVTAARSGIDITTDVNYPGSNAIDPIAFGVIRELLANVAKHSRASTASVTLAVVGDALHIDVVDDGVGVSSEAAARRVEEGHIGLASHRARIEAAGGALNLVDEPVGAHFRIEIPLRR